MVAGWREVVRKGGRSRRCRAAGGRNAAGHNGRSHERVVNGILDGAHDGRSLHGPGGIGFGSRPEGFEEGASGFARWRSQNVVARLPPLSIVDGAQTGCGCTGRSCWRSSSGRGRHCRRRCCNCSSVTCVGYTPRACSWSGSIIVTSRGGHGLVRHATRVHVLGHNHRQRQRRL